MRYQRRGLCLTAVSIRLWSTRSSILHLPILPPEPGCKKLQVDASFGGFTSNQLSWKIICALKHDAAADEYNNEALPALFSLHPASGPWYRCCGPTLAAVGAGRRSLSSCLHSLTGRLRGLRSSGAPGSGGGDAANASGGVGSYGHDAEARGRLLPWGA